MKSPDKLPCDSSRKRLPDAHEQLLISIKSRLPDLQDLLDRCSSHWGYEDPVYRYYHQSFKVYYVQAQTKEIIDALRAIAPHEGPFVSFFEDIAGDGAADKVFSMEHNRHWSQHTRPMLEAFFHARYFLEMAVKYGEELETAPDLLPSGWAALLCLYGLR